MATSDYLTLTGGCLWFPTVLSTLLAGLYKKINYLVMQNFDSIRNHFTLSDPTLGYVTECHSSTYH